nr:hypothetical protein [Pseudomonas sp. BSw22131]
MWTRLCGEPWRHTDFTITPDSCRSALPITTPTSQRSGGTLSQASQELGMAKATLLDKVKKYGLG